MFYIYEIVKFKQLNFNFTTFFTIVEGEKLWLVHSNESITNTVTPLFLYTKHNKYLNSCGNVRVTRFIVKVNAKTINIIHGYCIWLYSTTCSVKTSSFYPKQNQ